jgi:lysophospholipase L1-like esterase
MKIAKISSLLLISLTISAGLFLHGCAKREIKNLGSSGKNIICFGDSITFGYGVNPGEDYPTNLSRLLKRPVINAGVDGDTSFDGLKRIKADVLEKNPYLVLIEFTGNDFIKKIPVDSTIANMKEMVLQAQEKGAIVAIVDVSAGLFLLEYRLKLSNLARQTKAIFVPAVLSKIITNPSMKSDFMHPNAAGYKIVAERVLRSVSLYVKQDKSKALPVESSDSLGE